MLGWYFGLAVGVVKDVGRIAVGEGGHRHWRVYGPDRWLEVVVGVVADLGMGTAVVEEVVGLVGLGLEAVGALGQVRRGDENSLVVRLFVEAVAEGVDSEIAAGDEVAVAFVLLEVHIVMLRMRLDLALDVVIAVSRGRQARHRYEDRDCCTLKYVTSGMRSQSYHRTFGNKPSKRTLFAPALRSKTDNGNF